MSENSNSTENGPNIEPTAPDYYRKAYDTLFLSLPEKVKGMVIAAQGSDKVPPKEVTDFIKRVIELTEQDDNKKL